MRVALNVTNNQVHTVRSLVGFHHETAALRHSMAWMDSTVTRWSRVHIARIIHTGQHYNLVCLRLPRNSVDDVFYPASVPTLTNNMSRIESLEHLKTPHNCRQLIFHLAPSPLIRSRCQRVKLAWWHACALYPTTTTAAAAPLLS